MSAFNLSHRRTTATQIADHAEAYEVRVLLSGVAIYPQQAIVQETEAAPAGKVSPFTVPSDYNGTWDSIGGIFTFSVKGDDPETGKVKGTVSGSNIVGDMVKFKGIITNTDELTGKFHGKIFGQTTYKFKAQLSVQLTDSTHFNGTLLLSPKGLPEMNGPIDGEKI